MPKTKIIIRCKIETIQSPQRLQFKPYSYTLSPQETYLDIELEPDQLKEEVKSKDGNLMILNMDGFKAILSQLADAVDEVHNDYVMDMRKHGKVIL